MDSRRMRRHPTLAVALIVLLVAGAAPATSPAVATGGDPFQLNVIELSLHDPEEAVRVPADVPFFIQHPSSLTDGCLDDEPTPHALDSANGFVLLLDDTELDGEVLVRCEVRDDGGQTFVRGARYDFVEGLAASSYELRGIWTDADGETNLDLTMPIEVAPAAIRGVVSDRDSGAAIAGATVWGPAGPVTTWQDGSYAIFDLGPGEYSLGVGDATGYQDTNAGPITYDGVTMVTLDITMIPLTAAPDVLGAVTDAATGAPLVAAEVTLFWEDGGARIPSVPTDLDGVYAIRGVNQDRPFRLRVIGNWQLDHFPGWDAAVLMSEVFTFAGGAQLVIDLPVPPVSSFVDVASDNVHAAGIVAIASAGNNFGLPDGSFNPAGTVTRGQMASFLAEASSSLRCPPTMPAW